MTIRQALPTGFLFALAGAGAVQCGLLAVLFGAVNIQDQDQVTAAFGVMGKFMTLFVFSLVFVAFVVLQYVVSSDWLNVVLFF